MKRYLVDFEFVTPERQEYWLPLAIRAINGRTARVLAERIEHGLSEKYSVARYGPYPNGSYSADLLKEIRSGRRQGRPAILHLSEYKFRTIEFDPAITFDEHMERAVQSKAEDVPDEPMVIASMKTHRIPVRLVGEGEIEGLDEVLVINILSPISPHATNARDIPAKSTLLGTVQGEHFRATIYLTPDTEVAALVEVLSNATPLQLSREQMNTRICDRAIDLTGDRPDYMVFRETNP